MEYALHGAWNAVFTGGESCPVTLPGTLDESGVGQPDRPAGAVHPDAALGQAEVQGGPITTRLTRKYTYEGPVTFAHTIHVQPPKGERVFLEAERARSLRLRLNGEEIPHFGPETLSTPHMFEVTGKLTGEDWMELQSDNSYPGLPREAILNSSAATDETQTNWNGIVGRFRLVTRPQIFFSGLRVYPQGDGTVRVEVELDALEEGDDAITLTCEAFSAPVRQAVTRNAGKTALCLEIPVRADAVHWDEEEGNLYTLEAALDSGARRQETFGLRIFGVDQDGRFTLNGRRIFLRSEANCAVFPETGYPPMDRESWIKMFRRYRDYGVNCVRFHSYCPPQAAFEAGDRLGILIQPELSQWDPRTAFESPEAWDYYTAELEAILKTYANHPSFVLLTFGNELHAGELGHERMDRLLRRARELDPTRRYAEGSNPHYGARIYGRENGFYTAQEYLGLPLRGTFSCGENQSSWLKGYINNQYPSAQVNYDRAVERLRQDTPVPVFSFEVGQFQVLPELEEIERFRGGDRPGEPAGGPGSGQGPGPGGGLEQYGAGQRIAGPAGLPGGGGGRAAHPGHVGDLPAWTPGFSGPRHRPGGHDGRASPAQALSLCPARGIPGFLPRPAAPGAAAPVHFYHRRVPAGVGEDGKLRKNTPGGPSELYPERGWENCNR